MYSMLHTNYCDAIFDKYGANCCETNDLLRKKTKCEIEGYSLKKKKV